MKTTPHRTAGALIAVAAILLSVTAVAGSAQAAPRRHSPPPAPIATSVPAPAAAITVTGATTRLGSNFSAGGYARVGYTVKTTSTGTYAVRYTVDVAGSGVNTTVDGVSLNQVVVGASAPVTTSSFTLRAGTHTISTQSPDGYGETTIDLVRVG